MKKVLLFLFSLLIGIALFVWILRIVGWQEIKNAFLVFTGWQGLVILVLTVLMMAVGTWKWKEILRGTGVNIPFKALFGPYLAGFAAMFLAPILVWGGELFRSYVLKDREKIDFDKGMASVIIDRILEWTANLAVIFFGGLFFLLAIELPPIKLVAIFGGVFVIFLAGIVFFFFKSARKESIVKFFLPGNKDRPFEIEKEIFAFFKFENLALWKGVGLSFLKVAVMYLRTWFLVSFLAKGIGILPILSILGFSYLAVMIPIPTALGSHEVIQTFAFGALGLGSSTATAFTMIIRGAELLVALFGLALFFRLGIILLKNTIFRKISKITDRETSHVKIP